MPFRWSSLLVHTVSSWRASIISVFILGFQHFARCLLLGAQYLLNEQMDT